MHRAGLVRLVRMGLVYLLVAAAAALGWLWHALPGEICLEPLQKRSSASTKIVVAELLNILQHLLLPKHQHCD